MPRRSPPRKPVRASTHAFGAQRADHGVADRVRRQTGDVLAVHAEPREAHGDVGLAAAEGRDEGWRLEQPLESWRAETQHDLAERDDLHGRGWLYHFSLT